MGSLAEAFAEKLTLGEDPPVEGGEEKETEPVAPPVAPPEPEGEEEEAPPLDEEGKKELSALNRAERKKLEAKFLATPRGQRFKDAMVALRDLGLPESQGGIGFVPTKEEIQGFYDSHQLLGDLRLAWASGTPEGAEVLLGSFLGPRQEADGSLHVPAQAKALARNLFPVLRQKFPQAADEVAASVLARYMGNLQKRIEKQTDEGERKGMERLLRALKYDLTGKEDLPSPAAPAPPARGKTQEERELEYYRQQALQARRQDEVQFEESINEAVYEDLSAALTGLEGLKESLSESAYEAVRNGVLEDVLQQVRSKAPNGYRDFNRQVGVYRGTRRPEDLQRAVGMFSRLAKPYLVDAQRRAIRSQAKANEDQARASREQKKSAEKRAPAGGGVPGSLTDGSLARGKDETLAEWRERMFATAMRQGS